MPYCRASPAASSSSDGGGTAAAGGGTQIHCRWALAAQEAFLSSATGAAVPVVAVNGQTIGNGAPGALTRRIRELYFARTGVNTGLKKA